MNAVMRPEYEVPVLNNEAIEVHLASLRTGQAELREDVSELRASGQFVRDRIDAVQESLSQDIKALDKKVDEKIGAVDKKLDQKFDWLNTKIDAVNANLGEKINQLSNDVAGMRGLQKATIWLIGILGSLGTVGKFLHWF